MVKPPQIRERKPDIPYGQAAPSRIPESGNWLAASGNASRDVAEDARDSYNTGDASEDVNSLLTHFSLLQMLLQSYLLVRQSTRLLE